MERVVVSIPFAGLCYMQVCAVADATDEEILEVANRENPAGTENGWMEVARENDENEQKRPVQCADDPNRTHFILTC